jgi:hypothetical protein
MVFVDEDPDDPALIREYEMLARVFNSLAATYAEHFDDLPMMMATPEGRFVRFSRKTPRPSVDSRSEAGRAAPALCGLRAGPLTPLRWDGGATGPGPT